MVVTDKYSVVNIRKMMEDDNPELGESNLIELLSEFSCPKNPDVERFLKKSAVEFAKKNQSVTYLIFSVEDGEMLGYFTIALKPLSVRGNTVSNTVKKKLLRISELDEESQTYTMAAYLVGQLGKNYSFGLNSRITGAEMLELVWREIEKMQYMCGGVVAFLEAEDREKLLDFYQHNRFSKFDTRQIASDTEEPHELIQLLRLL